MNSTVLKVDRLAMSFGGIQAISGLSLTIHSGEIAALIGPNGAGKSVLVNLISGYYPPSAGHIWFDGQDVTTKSAFERSRQGVARTFQNIRLFRRMTVLENVMLALPQFTQGLFGPIFARGGAARRQAMDLLELVGLAERCDHLSGSLPYGDARSLEIARALATQPRLLMLDEPAAGMNEQETEQLRERILTIRQHVSALLVIEHDVSFLTAIASRMLALDQGRLIAEGDPKTVLRNPQVVAAYLGVPTDV